MAYVLSLFFKLNMGVCFFYSRFLIQSAVISVHINVGILKIHLVHG